MVLLWMDDVRPAPAGWRRARSVNEAVRVLESEEVVYASLDHDLGEYAADGGDGRRLTDWMAEHGRWPRDGIRIHSANPVGVAAMLATVDRYGPGPAGAGNHRGAPAPDPGPAPTA